MRLFGQQAEKWIHLDQMFLLGSGGEGHVYPLLNDSTLAAKLFHNETRADREDKLRAMMQNPPIQPGKNGHTSIAWPSDLLSWEPGGPVVGYLMPRVRHARVIDDYYNPPTRLEHCPLFHYEYLLCVARNLAAAVRSLHKRGYVIGDVKQSNILVTPNALVTLVDTDSFQVRDENTGRMFRCPVGTPEYTPPELQDQKATGALEPEHDLFGLAVLIFQLLMEGSHPFAGVYAIDEDPPPLGERIRLGHFPYRYSQRPPALDDSQTFMRQQTHFAPSPRAVPCSPGRKSLSFDVLPPELRSLFFQCFDDGYSNAKLRPDAQAWLDALDQARSSLVACQDNSQHRYGAHLSECPWCARMQSQLRGHDPFPSRKAVEAKPAKPPELTPLSPGFSNPTQTGLPWNWNPPTIPIASQPQASPYAPAKPNSFWGPAIFIGAVFSILGFLSLNFSPSTQQSAAPSENDPANYRSYPPTMPEASPPIEHSTPTDSTTGVQDALLSQNGKLIVISSDRVRIKSAESGKTLTSFPLSNDGGPIRALRMSPDSNMLAMSASDGTSLLMDRDWSTINPVLTSVSRPARSLDFSKDERRLALATEKDDSGESAVLVVNAKTGEIENSFKTDYGEIIACVRFTLDGKKLVATTSGANNSAASWRLYCWEVSSGRRLWTRSDILCGASLAISPDSQELAIGGEEVQLRRIQNGDQVDFSGMRGDVMDYSPHGDWLAISTSSQVMLLQKQSPFHTIKIPVRNAMSLTFPSSNRVMTFSHFDGVEGWELETGVRQSYLPMSKLKR